MVNNSNSNSNSKELSIAEDLYLKGYPHRYIMDKTNIYIDKKFIEYVKANGLYDKRQKLLKDKEVKMEKTVISMYKAGSTLNAIAKASGVSQSTVSKVVNKYGLEKRDNRGIMSKINHKDIVELYKSGKSLTEVGKLKGMSKTTVRDILKANGITIRQNFTYDENLLDECVMLYLSGYSSIDIENMTGVKSASVLQAVYRSGESTRGTPKYPRETKDKAIELYLDGKTFIEIANLTGISRNTIPLWLSESGFKSRGKVSTPEDVCRVVVDKYINGESVIDIYRDLSVPTTVTQRILLRYNIPIRPKRKLREEDRGFILELYKDFGTYEAVGKAIGFTGSTVSNFLNKRNK